VSCPTGVPVLKARHTPPDVAIGPNFKPRKNAVKRLRDLIKYIKALGFTSVNIIYKTTYLLLMRKNKPTIIVTVLMTALLIGVPSVCAQMTIGVMEDPNTGSLLDLKQQQTGGNANATRGLLLPRVQLTEPNKLYPMMETAEGSGIPVGSYDDPTEIAKINAEHVGLTVYNIPTQGGCRPLISEGVYIWNGTKWDEINADVTKYVDIEVNVPSGAKKRLRFLTYNLGANPNLTPKEQMGYVSTFSPANDHEDVTVFGGLFQWGRKDQEHSLRCSQAAAPGSFTQTLYTSTGYNPATDHLFVYGTSVWGNSFNWISPHVDASDLWGNGKNAEYGGNGEMVNGNPVPPDKKPDDPCPVGYRIPTEYEWALLGHKNGDITYPWKDFFLPSSDGSTIPSSGIVWVPVSNGYAKNDDWATDGTVRGYALYTQTEWNGAAAGYKNGALALTDGSAPDPLLFLPAAGQREDVNGHLRETGLGGFYWSSVVSTRLSHHLRFTDKEVNGGSIVNGRAIGMSIRCIAE
jgi:hypothetical protein